MEQKGKGTDEWLRDLAEEEPAAAHLAGYSSRPDDAFVPEWAATHWQAWHTLRFDRQYGAFGGQTPIAFVALDAYARRYLIEGTEFEVFISILTEMDDEYLQHAARVAKEEKEREEQTRKFQEI